MTALGHIAVGLLLAFDLAGVKAEPNLEKRAEKAMGHAYASTDAARNAYNAGEDEKFRSSVAEIRDSVELALDALMDTGKDPRKKPKAFKKMEQAMPGLLRKLSGLSDTVSVSDREAVDSVKQRVQQIQDELIQGILTKRK
jgi:hypothetical protein